MTGLRNASGRPRHFFSVEISLDGNETADTSLMDEKILWKMEEAVWYFLLCLEEIIAKALQK